MGKQYSQRSATKHHRKNDAGSESQEDLQLVGQNGFSSQANSIMTLQRTIGNQAVMRLLSNQTRNPVPVRKATVQRQPDITKTAPVKTDDKAPVLDGSEAARLVDMALFDSGGYFAATRDIIHQFQADMTTELGWYAGDKKESQSKKDKSLVDTGLDFAKDKARDKAKDLGKKSVEALITAFGAGAGPAGIAATGAIAGIEKLLTDNYDAVVTEPAKKKPHQIYIETLLKVTNWRHEALRDAWTAGTTELIKEKGAAGLKAFADSIKEETRKIRQRFYTQMAADYLAYAPDRSVTLETPHSKFTGEKQGKVDFFGYGAGAHFASKINAGEIYVEIDAKPGDRTDYMTVKRTIVPQLPSTVLAQLNDADMTEGQQLWALPYKRVIMELNGTRADKKLDADGKEKKSEPDNSVSYPARVVFNASDGKLDIAKDPSYSRQFCLSIAKAHGHSGNMATPGGEFSTLELEGAVLLWSWVVQRPLSEMNFSA